MNSLRLLLERLRTSKAALFLITVLLFFVILGLRQCARPAVVIAPASILPRSEIVDLVRTNVSFRPPRGGAATPGLTNTPTPGLPPIRLPVTNAPSSTVPVFSMPARRLIPCKLVNTVDSSSLETPIIALVTQDVFWQGRLILPSGTEVHGRAQAHHLRDRVGSQGSWVLIWPGGEEAALGGLALDMEQQEGKWGLTDGSAGLRGNREGAGNAEELKLFAATFLAGLTEPFQDRQNTVAGPQILPTLKNSGLTGAGAVMESYADRIMNSIERETFVRVAAGKTFYLYTLDAIRPPSTRSPSTLSPEPPPLP